MTDLYNFLAFDQLHKDFLNIACLTSGLFFPLVSRHDLSVLVLGTLIMYNILVEFAKRSPRITVNMVVTIISAIAGGYFFYDRSIITLGFAMCMFIEMGCLYQTKVEYEKLSVQQEYNVHLQLIECRNHPNISDLLELSKKRLDRHGNFNAQVNVKKQLDLADPLIAFYILTVHNQIKWGNYHFCLIASFLSSAFAGYNSVAICVFLQFLIWISFVEANKIRGIGHVVYGLLAYFMAATVLYVYTGYVFAFVNFLVTCLRINDLYNIADIDNYERLNYHPTKCEVHNRISTAIKEFPELKNLPGELRGKSD